MIDFKTFRQLAEEFVCRPNHYYNLIYDNDMRELKEFVRDEFMRLCESEDRGS